MEDNSKNYIKSIVFLFVGLAAMVGGIMAAYFGMVGLYFGQAVVDGDVFAGYKYPCINESTPVSQCTAFNTSAYTESYQAYQSDVAQLNDQNGLYLSAIGIVFSLLGLVFLFMALKSSGILDRKKGRDTRELM